MNQTKWFLLLILILSVAVSVAIFSCGDDENDDDDDDDDDEAGGGGDVINCCYCLTENVGPTYSSEDETGKSINSVDNCENFCIEFYGANLLEYYFHPNCPQPGGPSCSNPECAPDWYTDYQQ